MSPDSASIRKPGLIVYCCGLATSALALYIVHVLNNHEVNAMGFYVQGIIPAGALLVGIGSGLGYAVASRYLQVALGKAFVLGMITTALADWALAQYITYEHIIEQVGVPPERYSFVQYMRDTCEQMSFTSSRAGAKPGSPLGVWGYLFKLLEMAGYAFGAMVPSLVVSGMPYCKACQKYLINHRTGYLNTPQQWADIKKLSKQERTEHLNLALGALQQQAGELLGSIQQTSLTDTAAVVESLEKKGSQDAAGHIKVVLKKCPNCDAHHVQMSLANWTIDKQHVSNNIATLDKIQQNEPAA